MLTHDQHLIINLDVIQRLDTKTKFKREKYEIFEKIIYKKL
jgi:hypothetical protein